MQTEATELIRAVLLVCTASDIWLDFETCVCFAVAITVPVDGSEGRCTNLRIQETSYLLETPSATCFTDPLREVGCTTQLQ